MFSLNCGSGIKKEHILPCVVPKRLNRPNASVGCVIQIHTSCQPLWWSLSCPKKKILKQLEEILWVAQTHRGDAETVRRDVMGANTRRRCVEIAKCICLLLEESCHPGSRTRCMLATINWPALIQTLGSREELHVYCTHSLSSCCCIADTDLDSKVCHTVSSLPVSVCLSEPETPEWMYWYLGVCSV